MGTNEQDLESGHVSSDYIPGTDVLAVERRKKAPSLGNVPDRPPLEGVPAETLGSATTSAPAADPLGRVPNRPTPR
jgi:hypothetical protein